MRLGHRQRAEGLRVFQADRRHRVDAEGVAGTEFEPGAPPKLLRRGLGHLAFKHALLHAGELMLEQCGDADAVAVARDIVANTINISRAMAIP